MGGGRPLVTNGQLVQSMSVGLNNEHLEQHLLSWQRSGIHSQERNQSMWLPQQFAHLGTPEHIPLSWKLGSGRLAFHVGSATNWFGQTDKAHFLLASFLLWKRRAISIDQWFSKVSS